jgi:prepilin signal peptidase PulO-like enzyme (type II secretory pathway)
MVALVAAPTGRTHRIQVSSHVVLITLFWAAGVAIAQMQSMHLAGALVASAELTLLAGIAAWDARTLRAPNVAVLPGLAAVVAVSACFGAGALAQSAAGMGACFLLVGLVAVLGRGAMGAGDVKFGALVGAVVGLNGVLVTVAVAFIAGGVLAAIVLGLRLRDRKASMAFTPFLALGVVAALALCPVYLLR